MQYFTLNPEKSNVFQMNFTLAFDFYKPFCSYFFLNKCFQNICTAFATGTVIRLIGLLSQDLPFAFPLSCLSHFLVRLFDSFIWLIVCTCLPLCVNLHMPAEPFTPRQVTLIQSVFLLAVLSIFKLFIVLFLYFCCRPARDSNTHVFVYFVLFEFTLN